MLTEAQPGEKSKTDDEIWHSLSGNEGLRTVEPVRPDVLQALDGAGEERPLMTSDLVTERATDPPVWKLTTL